MNVKSVIAVVVMAAFLAACENNAGQKQTAGTVLGGFTGAILGAQVGKGKGQLVAVGVGTLLGAWAGREIGQSLDKADRLAMQQAEQQAYVAPIGQDITWSNPQSGHSGSVTPVREGTDNTSGNYCREFQQTVTIGGKTEEAYGVACRQPDGSWQIRN